MLAGQTMLKLNRVACFLLFSLVELCCCQRILGVYSMDDSSHSGEGGSIVLRSNSDTHVLLIGIDLTNTTMLYLTQHPSDCNGGPASGVSRVSTSNTYRGVVALSLQRIYGDNRLFICVKNGNDSAEEYVHQGTEAWLSFYTLDSGHTDGYYMPLAIQIIICVILLMLSGLFSGLNLGLLALDQIELRIISKAGSEKEKNWAKRIAPLRKRGNFLLCTFLLGNVIVNSTFTILFSNMTDGLISLISSTIGIVIFGEIVPQAICSRHGLAVGANTYWLTVLFMILTFPASYPISLILDKVLGEEMGQIYNKQTLQELIRMTADSRVLQDNEANIMSGAMQLTNKCVADVMTKASDVFMIGIHRTLDFETMSEIMHHGFTRVPVYDADKSITYLLNTKDLALIDPDDNIPVSTVCKFYDHKPLYVEHELKLDAMLQEFLKGDSHMAIVQRLHNAEDRDPYFETLGIVTLEDVLEEILQKEIIDEKDMIIENRLRVPRPRNRPVYEILGAEGQRSKLPKQLAFVAFQYLSTSVEPFSETCLAKHVLLNLMKKDIVINLSPTEPVSQKNYLYQKGVPTDRFVLILQGTVEVIACGENMVFESGPFSYFGVDALDIARRQSSLNVVKAKDYVPDFSARAVTDVQYLCIDRSLYLVALKTTEMLRTSGSMAVKETFDAEMEKMKRMKHNYDGSMGTLGNSSTPSSPVERKHSHPSILSQLKVDSLVSLCKSFINVSDSNKDNTKASENIQLICPDVENQNNSLNFSPASKGRSFWKIGADSDGETTSSPPHNPHSHNPHSHNYINEDDTFVITETNCQEETRVIEKIPLINLNPSPIKSDPLGAVTGSTLAQNNINKYDNEDRTPLLSQTSQY